MKKFYAVATMAVMLCLAGFVMPGASFAQCMDNKNGTVTDTRTSLMWQKATAGPMDWDTAMSYASGLSLGGHSGWRLPNKDELQALYHSPCKSMMEVVLSDYWSSTPYADDTLGAWLVGFFHGYVYLDYKSSSYYVRAVRGGQ